MLSHALAYGALLFIPAHSVQPNFEFVILLNSIFISIVVVVSLVTYKLLPLPVSSIHFQGMTVSQLRFNVAFSSLAALFGIALVFYDRVFLRGIDYSVGLRNARYQWLASEGGSLASITGNLLIPFCYVSIFFLVVHYSRLSRFAKFLLFSSSFLGVFGHAALNGGRSNVLLAIIMVLSAYVLKRQEVDKFSFFSGYYKLLPIGVIAIFYVASIIKSSAVMGGVDVETLTVLGIESLYGQVGEHFQSLYDGSEYIYLMMYGVAYLYHGQWTAQVAYSLPVLDGSYTLYPFSVILHTLGIIDAPLKTGFFSDTGAFISLPGAFYYDFGFVGVVILSLLVGLLLGLVLRIISGDNNIGGVRLAFVVYILFLVFLSPILPAYGLSYLNFIVFAFIFLGVLNSLLYRRGFSLVSLK
jgi:oligosaccharide repeat unit polymerase